MGFGEKFSPFDPPSGKGSVEMGNGFTSVDFLLKNVGRGRVHIEFDNNGQEQGRRNLSRFQGRATLTKEQPDPVLSVSVDYNNPHGPKPRIKCFLGLPNIELESDDANSNVDRLAFADFRGWREKDSSETFNLTVYVGSRDSAPHYDFGILNDIQIYFER